VLPSTSHKLEEIYIVRCLTHISQRYFEPGPSVVMSSPSNYRDVQQELTAEVHQTHIWPVVVNVDGNIRIAEYSGCINEDGNYLY